MSFVYPDADPGYEDDQPTPDELEAWDASDRQDALHASGFYDDDVSEWPAAALATPPGFPFNVDRHDYADNAEPSEADLIRYYNHEGGEDPVTRQQIRDAGRPGL